MCLRKRCARANVKTFLIFFTIQHVSIVGMYRPTVGSKQETYSNY